LLTAVKQKQLCFAQPSQKAPHPSKSFFHSRKDSSQLEIVFAEVSEDRQLFPGIHREPAKAAGAI